MDLWLLGAAAIVLIAITVWIVWPARAAEAPAGAAAQLPPQGDAFEDQYTSATADLSAGGVAEALTEAHSARASALAGETRPQPAPAAQATLRRVAHEATPTIPTSARKQAGVGLGAAALLTVGGAIGGAWLYARWQRQRKAPINRIKRRFR
jgi:hypothetical protein